MPYLPEWQPGVKVHVLRRRPRPEIPPEDSERELRREFDKAKAKAHERGWALIVLLVLIAVVVIGLFQR